MYSSEPTQIDPTDSKHGVFARRHGLAFALRVLLICAVAYGVDAKRDNESVHVANDALSSELASVTSQKDDAVTGLEADVTAREKAVASIEEKIVASQVTDGTWSVGSDVRSGTYRTTDAVASDCYWKITAGGSNGSDILENDIPGGGYPVVTVQDGQVFTSARCGTWAKQ
jgi:hypothetical protein